MTHAFAKVGKKRSSARDPLDRYETPEYATRALLDAVSFDGTVLEPAAGTGRIVRVLREAGYHVDSADVQRGRDFLRRRAQADNVVTNPPYGGKLPEMFVRKALEIVPEGGKVAMLLKHGFLWSGGRSRWLEEEARPSALIIMSDRIMFEDPRGRPIKGQFFDHLWIVWERGLLTKPERLRRGLDPDAMLVCINGSKASNRIEHVEDGAEQAGAAPCAQRVGRGGDTA